MLIFDTDAREDIEVSICQYLKKKIQFMLKQILNWRLFESTVYLFRGDRDLYRAVILVQQFSDGEILIVCNKRKRNARNRSNDMLQKIQEISKLSQNGQL